MDPFVPAAGEGLPAPVPTGTWEAPGHGVAAPPVPLASEPLSRAAGESLQAFKAEVFKALSHPTRIRILELLRDQECSVSDLGEALGLDISNVSQHLTVLRHKSILQGRKDGLTVYYQVKNRRLYQVLDLFRDWFFEHVKAQKQRLDVIDSSP